MENKDLDLTWDRHAVFVVPGFEAELAASGGTTPSPGENLACLPDLICGEVNLGCLPPVNLVCV